MTQYYNMGSFLIVESRGLWLSRKPNLEVVWVYIFFTDRFMESRLQQFESKMETPRFLWLFNTFLTLIILANAEVGHLLGVRGLPVSVSVVWASTGFSLAAILLLGYRI